MLRFLFTLTVGVALGFFLAKLREGQIDQARLREARDEAIRYRSQVAAARQSVVAEASAPPPQDDDLTRINGIGPAFQGRLRAAGIHSFAQLAASDPATLRAAVAAPDWQKVQPDRWIEEAGRLAAGG